MQRKHWKIVGAELFFLFYLEGTTTRHLSDLRCHWSSRTRRQSAGCIWFHGATNGLLISLQKRRRRRRRRLRAAALIYVALWLSSSILVSTVCSRSASLTGQVHEIFTNYNYFLIRHFLYSFFPESQWQLGFGSGILVICPWQWFSVSK